jgi:hypothetical protein
MHSWSLGNSRRSWTTTTEGSAATTVGNRVTVALQHSLVPWLCLATGFSFCSRMYSPPSASLAARTAVCVLRPLARACPDTGRRCCVRRVRGLLERRAARRRGASASGSPGPRPAPARERVPETPSGRSAPGRAARTHWCVASQSMEARSDHAQKRRTQGSRGGSNPDLTGATTVASALRVRRRMQHLRPHRCARACARTLGRINSSRADHH